MSTKMQVEWRRNKAFELLSKGNSQSEIAKVLQVDLSIISRDVYYLRQQAKSNIKKYVNETLPEEYEKCLVGINSILKEAWNTSQQVETNKKEKIQALSLAKECYSMKLDLLTNATVVNDAIKFVSSNNNKKPVSREEDSSSSQEPKEQEPDYDEDKEQLEEKQEEETGEISTETMNQVF